MPHRFRVIISIWFVGVVCLPLTAMAQPQSAPYVASSEVRVPRLVHVSGVIGNPDGQPIDGIVALTLSIYAEQTGGVPLWQEVQAVQLVKDRYALFLGGANQDLPLELFASGEARWLGVQANGRDEQPRLLMVSVPYALKAGDADTLGGKPASAFMLAIAERGSLAAAGETDGSASITAAAAGTGNTKSIKGSGTAGFLSKFVDPETLGDSVIFETTGRVGIGTTAPTATVEVQGNVSVAGATPNEGLLQVDQSALNGDAIVGTSASGRGVVGSTAAANGAGLVGEAMDGSGATRGVLGEVWSANGVAGEFRNRGGGDLLIGTAGPEPSTMFRVDEAGAVYAGAYLDLAGNPIPGGDITSVSVGSGLSGGSAAGDVSIGLDTGFTDGRYAPLVHGHDVTQISRAATLASNTFSGTQTILGGNVDVAGAVNTDTQYNIGGIRVLTVADAQQNAFVGPFAGLNNTTGSGNTAIGVSALRNTTNGSSNTAVGTNALVANGNGSSNTATGGFAMRFNTTGVQNVATGYLAISDNTTGSGNTATGTSALQRGNGNGNTAVGLSTMAGGMSFFTGSENTAIGVQALREITSGGNNTAAGYGALLFNSAGSDNTASGHRALVSNTVGSRNVAIGTNAGVNNATGSNNIYLGAHVEGVAEESDTMYLGGTQTKTVIAGVRGTTVAGGEMVLIDASGRLGSGTVAPGSNSVGTTEVIDDSLTSNDLAANSITASELSSDSVSADKVAFTYAGSTTKGGPAADLACLGCVAASEVSFAFATLAENTFAATQAIDTGNLDLDPSTSTTGNITKNGTRFLHNFGVNNTFLGAEAGNFTMAGNANVGIGTFALRHNTTGDANVGIGGHALDANTTGFDNIAIGDQTLQANTSGVFNTAVGAGALIRSTGSNNVAVGLSAGSNATAGSNNIYLGALVHGVAGESNAVYVGRPGTHTKTVIAGIRAITTLNNDAVPVMIDSSGQLGTVSSSRRFKEDIRDMGGASDRLFRLRPVTFRYEQPFRDGTKPVQYGLIAEEVAEAFPELAVRNAGGEVETVHYEKLNVLLLNELQKQRRRIEALERLVREILIADETRTVVGAR